MTSKKSSYMYSLIDKFTYIYTRVANILHTYIHTYLYAHKYQKLNMLIPDIKMIENMRENIK